MARSRFGRSGSFTTRSSFWSLCTISSRSTAWSSSFAKSSSRKSTFAIESGRSTIEERHFNLSTFVEPLQTFDFRKVLKSLSLKIKDGVVLGFSTKDEPVRLVSLSFAELLTYRNEDKLNLESNITTLEDTKTPHLSCIENSILLFRWVSLRKLEIEQQVKSRRRKDRRAGLSSHRKKGTIQTLRKNGTLDKIIERVQDPAESELGWAT